MKKLLSILLALLMILSLAACAKDEAPADDAADAPADAPADDAADAPAADGKMKLGVSWNFMINESATETQAFLNEYAEEYDFDIVHLVADDDAAQQIADVNDLISQECDVIACVPVDSAAIPTMVNAAKDAGIPFINFNRPLANEDAIPDASFVPDSEAQAYDAVVACFDQMIAAGIEDIKIIDIIGALTDENAVNRDNGLKRAKDDYIAKGYAIEIVSELECDWDNEWITSNLPAAVTANPDANMLFVPSDYCASAVATSLETAGRWVTRDDPNHIWICSQDVYIDGYKYMADGYFDSNALLSNDLLAQAVVEGAMKLYAGESYGDGWNVLVPCPVYTPDNYADADMIDMLTYKDEL